MRWINVWPQLEIINVVCLQQQRTAALGRNLEKSCILHLDKCVLFCLWFCQSDTKQKRHTKRNICSEKGKGRCPSRVRKRCDCDVERCEGDCQYFACSVQWLSSRPSAPLHDLLIIKSPVFNIACVVDTPTEGKPANCYPKYYLLHPFVATKNCCVHLSKVLGWLCHRWYRWTRWFIISSTFLFGVCGQ